MAAPATSPERWLSCEPDWDDLDCDPLWAPVWLLDWLRFVPIAVLAALCAIEVLLPGGRPVPLLANPALPAIVAAFAVAAASRSLLGTVAAGVGSYWLLLGIL